jgi:hypothetical protein
MINIEMSDWGEQLGDLAQGVGFGAASYELAKHDPKGFVSLQKMSFVFLILFFVIFLIILVVGVVTNFNKKDKT